MYQASGRLRYGLKPVPCANFDAFESRRLRDYLTQVLDATVPAISAAGRRYCEMLN